MRYLYFDNARIFMMILGVFLHAALLFRPDANFFVQFEKKDVVFTYLAYWIHLFRMPLFFFISGFLSAIVLEKVPSIKFIERRSVRLLVPFFVSLVTLNAFSIWWIKDQPLTNAEGANLVMHLWFIPALFIFALIHCRIHLKRIFEYLISFTNKIRINVQLAYLFYISFLSLALFVLEHLSWRLPLHQIKNITDGFIDAPLIFSYVGYYFLGVAIFYFKDNLNAILRCWPAALLIVTVFAFWHFSDYTKDNYLFELAGHACSLSMSLLVLSFFYYAFPDHWYKSWFSTFSYTLYLFHLPVILIIRLPIMSNLESIYAQYCAITFFTLVICAIAHYFIMKSEMLSLLYNGKEN